MPVETPISRRYMVVFGPRPLFTPPRSTPLDDGREDHVVPKLLLWAMKDHCRTRLGHHSDPKVERQFGAGDDVAFMLDAGAKLVTIGRLVGSSPDGSTYCLVGTVDRGRATKFEAEWSSASDVFAAGSDFVLCAVYDGGDTVSNIADVEWYPDLKAVPPAYLPPSPFTEFPDLV